MFELIIVQIQLTNCLLNSFIKVQILMLTEMPLYRTKIQQLYMATVSNFANFNLKILD